MRQSVISSSVATIVATANDSLVAAGMAVRAHLRHPNMRERLGYGQRQRNEHSGSTWSVVWQLCQGVCLKRPVQHAFALSPAYAAIARLAQRG